jgi:S1-C subfamily serine protease
VVIDGHRILTNAHVVAYAGQLQVQADREGDKYSAKVAAVAPGIDLAVLTLDDESFFQRHAPLERSSTLPEIKDAVLAYGFPVGGTSLSITKGIVSRIEFTGYNANCRGTARADRCGDQSGQQRRAGHGRRQDDRPGL